MTAVGEKVTHVEEDYDIVDTGHGNKPIIQTTIGMKNRTNNDLRINCDAYENEIFFVTQNTMFEI